MDVYNLSYNEIQVIILQMWRKHFSNDHASHAFIRQRVIVADTNKNPNAIVGANLSFAGPTRSNTQYLMTKNKQLAQNLQDDWQEIEQLCVAA